MELTRPVAHAVQVSSPARAYYRVWVCSHRSFYGVTLWGVDVDLSHYSRSDVRSPVLQACYAC